MPKIEVSDQEAAFINRMRLPLQERLDEQRAKRETRMTPEQKAEHERLAALPPEVRRIELLLRHKVATEKRLRAAPLSGIASRLSREAQAELAGFLKRGTVVKEG